MIKKHTRGRGTWLKRKTGHSRSVLANAWRGDLYFDGGDLSGVGESEIEVVGSARSKSAREGGGYGQKRKTGRSCSVWVNA
jgi:hypothetical protein